MQFTSFADSLFRIGINAWDKLPQLLLTLIIGYLFIKLIKAVLHGAIKVTHANTSMKGILISVIDVALWIFLIAALLQQVGLTQISLALSGSVAIAGIAISVGSSAFVQDLVAGLFLAQDKDFNTGDIIKVGEIMGRVERMDARKIRLRDEEGNLHIFPNSMLDKEAWVVLQKKNGGK
ncbi:MAG TPA: mechanosensitive ion channel domain-containing protein [Candidatus Saccharimonadales bacterium]|nr:mechanosensitive ion channel domain-containing protein [Candidatus Saccharimonadales bacterium]